MNPTMTPSATNMPVAPVMFQNTSPLPPLSVPPMSSVMSQGVSGCYKTSDNRNFDCPPRMSDGRHFTDYRPNCEMTQLIKADNNINNSYQFRLFMQMNGEALSNIDRKKACQKNCCAPCVESFNGSSSTMLPEQYLVNCNGRTCDRTLSNSSGLGDGRVYFSSPPNCENLPSTFPSQASNNCVAPLDKFAYFGEWVSDNAMGRLSVPGGGVVPPALGGCSARA